MLVRGWEDRMGVTPEKGRGEKWTFEWEFRS